MSPKGAIVDLVVAERKRELARHRVVVEAGSVVKSEVDAGEAQVVFTLPPADAEAVKAGTLDLSVAFMRGTTKMAGDYGVLLHVLPVLSRSAVL